MKKILFTISLIFFVTNCATIQCCQKQTGYKRPHDNHADSEQPIHDPILKIAQDFIEKYQAFITAFISKHPDKLYKESRYLYRCNHNIIASWRLTYDNETELYFSQKYTPEDITLLSERSKELPNLENLSLSAK